MDRISICESLLKRNEIEPFLKRLITEKWITYDNNVQRNRGRSKVKLRKRWQSQNWRQEKWCSVSVVGLERNCSLRAAAARSNDWF